jgi:hypothetical protein
VQSKAAAIASAAATDGTNRSISMALMAVRETPARWARSACDHPRLQRRWRTRLVDSMIVSVM